MFRDKWKTGLFFPFYTILSALALPHRHRVWLAADSGLGGNCLSEKAECRPPFACACSKYSYHLNPAPSSGLWCLVGLLNEQLLFLPNPEAKVLRVPLPAHQGREPRSFHGHSSPCWPGASGVLGWGQGLLPVSQCLEREKAFSLYGQVASQLKTFWWRPIALRDRFKVLQRLPKSSITWLLCIFHCSLALCISSSATQNLVRSPRPANSSAFPHSLASIQALEWVELVFREFCKCTAPNLIVLMGKHIPNCFKPAFGAQSVSCKPGPAQILLNKSSYYPPQPSIGPLFRALEDSTQKCDPYVPASFGTGRHLEYTWANVELQGGSGKAHKLLWDSR